MNEHEAQRVAAAANALRPDWPTSSVLTLIRKNLMDRPRRDVAVALTWIACEANTSSPARVLEFGPWWRAAAIEGSARPLSSGPVCVHCGYQRHECERRWRTDHAYEGPDDWMRRQPDTTNTAATVAGLRDLVAHGREEREMQQAKAKKPDSEPSPGTEAARALITRRPSNPEPEPLLAESERSREGGAA